METNIQIFRNETFGEIRTMTNEKGETFFVGKDVAEALGYAKGRNALAAHVEEEDKTTALIQGGCSNLKSNLILINESGLYSLILSSQLPQAKAFKRWVTSEVLPAIRKTGRYELLPEDIKLLGEQADYCQKVLRSVDCVTTTQVAKEMSMSGPDLYRLLLGLGVIYWQSGQYMLYADYARMGWLRVARTAGVTSWAHGARLVTWCGRRREGSLFMRFFALWAKMKMKNLNGNDEEVFHNYWQGAWRSLPSRHRGGLEEVAQRALAAADV